MIQQFFKKFVEKKLQEADIKINGSRPWDIQVHNEKFYGRVIKDGSLGLGEAYMEGWIDCQQLDEMIFRLLQSNVGRENISPMQKLWLSLLSFLHNKQSMRKALEVGETHYDLGNELFECMLDKRMTYSCGYWKNARNLDDAQEAKMDLVCKKLGIKSGDRVLDIGCGWGSFAKFAAEKVGAHVVGITISQEQCDLAKEQCKGLPVEIRFQDYREINEPFDYIVSIGQMEHVGYKNYRTYMNTVQRCLKERGLFLLHTIGGNLSSHSGEPWLDKYIFPNGMIPSVAQIAEASEGVFIMEDWHNFGAYYDKTLMAWFENFSHNWHRLKEIYSDRFYRMWTFYLLSCAGTFRSRDLQLWQIVFSKCGIPGGYLSLR
jgi:cyclopropane-fatty-acyl-phospholipid synthase